LGPTLEISILGCSRRYLLSAVQGDIYSRLFKEISTLGCSRRYLLSAVQGDIYSRLFKEISTLGCSRRYLLSAVQGDIYSRLFKEISTLGCSRRYLLSAVQVHTTTHCMFNREQHWVPHLLIAALGIYHVKVYTLKVKILKYHNKNVDIKISAHDTFLE
jgi:hypothetical protein